jgi:predicted nucleic acid-binding protein
MMQVLIDTGILLRLFDRLDPGYDGIQAALRLLWTRGDDPVITPQNAAEFWNVSTRPASARGGYGQPVAKVQSRLAAIERICRVLPETPAAYAEWKRLVAGHGVTGVSVHDARIVAQMNVWRVVNILTLNTPDFRRYSGIVATTPAELLSSVAH